jgi:uncharacterized protein
LPTLEDARAWYSETDPVHGFDHVQRVYCLAEKLARREGADLEIVLAAALLHDVDLDRIEMEGGALQANAKHRSNHHRAAAAFARQVLKAEAWDEGRILAVVHCIEAHRFRDFSHPPQTLEAQVLFDADKLDAIGAIGAARAISYAVTHKQPVFAKPSEHFLIYGETSPGEPHSAYHEHLFKLRRIKARLYTRSAKILAEARHQFLEDFFTRLGEEIDGER